MSTDEVQILKRAVEDLTTKVDGMRSVLGIIHKAVVDMAGRTYVPGPRRRSWWSKVGSIFGCLI